jgi:hypothetical protein
MFKQLSVNLEGPSEPRKTALEKHTPNSKPTTQSSAAEATERLLKFYGPLDVLEPKVFIAGIVAILAEYPPMLHAAAVAPNGIPKRIKYLRSLAEIEELCRDLYEPIARRITRDAIASQPKQILRRRTAEEQAKIDAQVEAWRNSRRA